MENCDAIFHEQPHVAPQRNESRTGYSAGGGGQERSVIKPYRSFCNLSEGKIMCVMEAPDKKSLAAWFEKMHVPCDGIAAVELEGERGDVHDA